MSGYSAPTRRDDPIHTVRSISRMAQLLLELRDEYVERPREDTLAQIDQRLDELISLQTELRQRMATSTAENGESEQ